MKDPLKSKIVTLLANRSKDIPLPLTRAKVEAFYKQAPEFIKKGLQPYGYFQPQVQASIGRIGIDWNLVFTVHPGPVVKVIHVDLKIEGEGANDRAFKKLSQNLPIKVGQDLNVDNYQDAKNALFNLAANRGYFDAKMTLSQIIINIPYRQASIVLHFDTGKRYRFGETLFPASDLRLNLLERFLRYKPGEYYSSAKVQKTQQALASSGFFAQSVVTPLTTNAEQGTVPIKVELTPVKPRRYMFGVGYGTDTGPRGTFGFTWTPINSYGHHINFLARGSYINLNGQKLQNNTISGSYIIPGRDPATDSYAISAGYGKLVQTTGNAESFKAGVSYNTILYNDWQQVLALTYLTENYRLTEPPTPNIHANVLYPSGHWQYLYNRSSYQQKIINNGVSAAFDAAGASKAIISKTNFLQGKASGKVLATLEQTHTRFLARGLIARTQINNLDQLPLTLQLFAGGPTSIRGFKYNSLGPAKNLAILSGEIQQRIYGNWYLAAFIDTGSLTDRLPDSPKYQDFVAGAGAGVVVLTPIGAVELALARPLPVFEHPPKTWQFEFSVGAEL